MSEKAHPAPDNDEEANVPMKRHHPSTPAHEDSHQIIAAIYWDVNCICHFQKIIADNPSQEDITSYENMKLRAEAFINKTVLEYLTAQDNSGLPTRCAQFINETSWKMFSICAHSEAFQVASENLEGENWLELKELIKKNSRSLEVFARLRKLEWRGCLLVYGHYSLPGLEAELTPDIDIAQEHPHHTVLLEDGHLRRPVYQGVAQTNIASSIWNPLDFPFHAGDPCVRTPAMGKCHFCGDPNKCACTLKSLAGDLIELVEYPGKGIGIRSLAYFKKDEWVAEYTGMVGPYPTKFVESVYPLTQVYTDCQTGEWHEPASVFAHQFGNWTRFMNHSCQPNVRFAHLVIGDRVITVTRVVRDISIFEEITVDYGEGYWRTRPHLSCNCGYPNCYRPAQKS